MLKNNALVLLFFLISGKVIAQDSYDSFSIPSELLENANAVIRYSEQIVTVEHISELNVKKTRVITVLNKKGNRHVDAYLGYNPSLKIKKLNAIVYNSLGVEIKKFKKSDFNDESAISGGTMYSDSRVKFLKYTPRLYPYTIKITTEYSTLNTAFIRGWTPLNGYNLSIEYSKFTFKSETIPFRVKMYNDNLLIHPTVNKTKSIVIGELVNQKAIDFEYLAPVISDLVPNLSISLNQFNLFGKKGGGSNWKEFGKWQYDNLLAGRDELDDEVIAKINKLTKHLSSDLEKAKIIYKYVQDNTRYISVQLGIGGLQPQPASDVDRLKYGDCKGLSNYTKALLNSQNIDAFYAEVYAGSVKKNVDNDFTSFQGNHIILYLPQENKDPVWLECTSQTSPFGFLGDFTDDRDVLVMKPTGGEIMHTTRYIGKDNTQISNSKIQIDIDGSMQVNLNINSTGLQYDNLKWIDKLNTDDKKEYYLDKWTNLNGLEVKNVNLINSKFPIFLKEELSMSASKFAILINDKMLLPINPFNRSVNQLVVYKDRKLPFQIKRSFIDTDTNEFQVPTGYQLDYLPEDTLITSEFGTYSIQINKISESEFVYKRKFEMNEGVYINEKYVAYADFLKKIIKKDKIKFSIQKVK